MTWPNVENEVNFTQSQWPGINNDQANYTEKLLVDCEYLSFPPNALIATLALFVTAPQCRAPRLRSAGGAPSQVHRAESAPSASPWRPRPILPDRWYDQHKVKPHYPFGHGLSYTSFGYSNLKVAGTTVSVDIKNTGSVAGAEVAQLSVPARSAVSPTCACCPGWPASRRRL